MVDLINQYPWILYILLVAGGLSTIALIIGFIQGRSISTPFGSIGAKSAKDKGIESKPIQNVQSTSFYLTASLNPDQMEDIANRVAEKVRGIMTEIPNERHADFFQPHPLPDRIEYIIAVRYQIEGLIRALVLSTGGEWAGASWAGFETYFEYAQSLGIISQKLAEEISDFYSYTQEHVNSRDVPDVVFNKIKILAYNINRQLNEIPLGPLG